MEEGSSTNKEPCFMRWIARDDVVRTCSYNMLLTGRYTDCVLSAEGFFVACHQIVVASCSPYLDELLKSNQSGEKPTLILAGIKAQDLLLAVNYMYTGQAEVPPDQISSFVSTVLYLKIKGVIYEIDDPPSQKISAPTPPRDSYICVDTMVTVPAIPSVVIAELSEQDSQELSDESKDFTTLTVSSEEPPLTSSQENAEQPAVNNTYEPEVIREITDELEGNFKQPVVDLKAKKKVIRSLSAPAVPRSKRQSKMPSHLEGFDLPLNKIKVPTNKIKAVKRHSIQTDKQMTEKRLKSLASMRARGKRVASKASATSVKPMLSEAEELFIKEEGIAEAIVGFQGAAED